MAAATSPSLPSSITGNMQTEMEKIEETKESFWKKKSEGQVAPSNCFTWTRSDTWEEWLCVSADIYLDGFTLVAILTTSYRARELKQWRDKTYKAASMFSEANSFLQYAFREDTMEVPGFGAEDGQLIGELLPLKSCHQPTSKNLHHIYRNYVLKNPKFPTTECFTRWCRIRAIPHQHSVSLSAAITHLNPLLYPDATFDSLQMLLGSGVPKIAPPTELRCMNPYTAWEHQTVPCHPPILLMISIMMGSRVSSVFEVQEATALRCKHAGET